MLVKVVFCSSGQRGVALPSTFTMSSAQGGLKIARPRSCPKDAFLMVLSRLVSAVAERGYLASNFLSKTC